MSLDIVGKCATTLSDPVLVKIKEVYNDIKKYEENVNKLQDKVDGLTRHWNDINEKVKQGKLKGEVLNKVADNWLQNVDKLVNKDKKLKKLMNEEYRKQKDQCCFGTCHINPFYRYKCSKEAKVKGESIQDRIDDVPKEAVTRPQSPAEVKSIIDGYKKCGSDLESRKKVMDDVLQKLQDDQVKLVGLYGEEAVGKTRLVSDIVNTFIRDGSRRKEFMVEVKRADSTKDIQDQIKRGLHKVSRSYIDGGRWVFLYDKILICLDSIWEKFDLHKVGILKHSRYKVLMVSRKKSLCTEMGVDDSNMFELRRLTNEEARNLFWAKVSLKENVIISGEYLSVAEKLVSKCGGLPLAVVTLAAVLSGNTLLYWERFAAELEKPPPSIGSSQQQLVGGWRDDDHEYCSILETSYLLLSTEERMMFLLCFLFPPGAPVQELIRCAIGLGLIEWVDTFIEAEVIVSNWINRLISSTLVEDVNDHHKPDIRQHVKIPDLVRKYGISILAKDNKHMVLVERFPRWMSLESCSKYYAISLMSGSNHFRLNKLNSDKLRILILDDTRGEFEDTFFQGMKYLMVLVLRRMELKPKLQSSMLNLKSSLTTLIMEDCALGDITGIGELTNLVVLSLRNSIMVEIPEAIGNLCNLRLLDLSYCIIKRNGIAANVLSKLSLLEGLYAFQGRKPSWRYNNNNDDSKKGEYSYYARFAELNCLSFLKLLQLQVASKYWPIDDHQLQFLSNLDHFRICFGELDWEFLSRGYSRALSFNNNYSLSSIVKYNGVRVLLEKTQYLKVFMMWELQHFNDDIQQQEGDETKIQLSNIHFPLLQHLEIWECPMMQSLSSTPFKAPNLNHLQIEYCSSMKYIFMEHDDQLNNAHGDPHITTVTFPCLKLIHLSDLWELESVTGIIKRGSGTTNDDEQPGHHILFNHKTTFPLLEKLKLIKCNKIMQLWEVNCKEMSYYSSFNNLHYLEIEKCKKLESLGSLSIATALVQLKKLAIRSCPLLMKVISSEEIEAPTFGDEILPSLESVELKDCPELKMFITRGELKGILQLSSLHQLKIEHCPKMDSFSSVGPSFKTPKLNKVTLDSNEYSKDEIKDDINSFLQTHNKPKPKCEDESEKTKVTK